MIRTRRASKWSVGPALFLMAGGCSSFGVAAPSTRTTPLLSVGEWTSFVGSNLRFYEDGYLVYERGQPKDAVARLDSAELLKLKAFLDSEQFVAALETLRAGGYEPGCCDMREVALTYRGESLGYPVCDDEAIDDSVAQLVDLINDLGSRHFRHFRGNPLPKMTCS